MTDTPDTQMTEGQRGPSFWPRLHHQQITVRLAGAPSVIGDLVAYSIYEIVIRGKSGRETLIPKHAIVSVETPAGWRTLPAGTQEGNL